MSNGNETSNGGSGVKEERIIERIEKLIEEKYGGGIIMRDEFEKRVKVIESEMMGMIKNSRNESYQSNSSSTVVIKH